MSHDLPQSLITSIKNNTLIPFVGAGISMGVKDNQNNQLFDNWTNSLLNSTTILQKENKDAQAVRIKSGLEIAEIAQDYLDIASEIYKYLDSQWNEFLTNTFDKNAENINSATLDIPREILKINNLVITTNYDNVLKWSCENKDDLIEWDKKAIYGQVDSLRKTPEKQTLWYLHGKISNPDDIVFTKGSYEETYKESSGAVEVLKHHLLTKNFIFCGFSLDDPYLQIQLKYLKKVFGTNISKHFIILKKGQRKNFKELGDINILEITDPREDEGKDYLKLLQTINSLKQKNEKVFTSQIKVDKPLFFIPFESKKNDVVGLERKLEEIHTKLSTARQLKIGQVAKFEGMGGLGKTQLAVEYVYKYKDTYPNGILWFTMDQDLEEQLLNLGRECNLVNQNLELKDQLTSIKNQLKSFENILLIYDNINERKDLEKDFFPTSSTNKILVTTRNPIQGYELIELETLSFENSKKLLEIESGKKISDDEIVYIQDLYKKLEGLPLALEMAGAYVKFLNISWQDYLKLYNENNLELLNKTDLPESFTKHENNIVNTLTISQNIIENHPFLEEIINLLCYGAKEPIDDELITKLLNCNKLEIIEPLSIGKKLKYIKETSQGYTIHRLLKEVWKTQTKLEQIFITTVANSLSSYIYKIKDEYLNLPKLEKAILFSEQWIDYLDNNNKKAILIAYKAYLNYYKGDFKNGLEILNLAKKTIGNEDSEEYVEILIYLGFMYNSLGKTNHAKDFYKKAYELRKKLYPNNEDHPDIANSLNNLGVVWKDKDFHKALEFYTQSYEMFNRLYSNNDHRNIANVLNNLGLLWKDKDLKKSLDFYTQSYEMNKRLYPNDDHPSIANSLNNLGAFWEIKDFNKALKFYTQSYEMYNRLYLSENHHNIANSLNNLGVVWKDKDFHKALEFYTQSYEMYNRLYLSEDHPDIANSLNNLGTLWEIKDFNKALKFYTQSYEMFNRLYPNDDHPKLIISMFNLSYHLLKSLVTKKKGVELLKKYKKIVTRKEDLEKITNTLRQNNPVNRNKSKRKINKN